MGPALSLNNLPHYDFMLYIFIAFSCFFIAPSSRCLPLMSPFSWQHLLLSFPPLMAGILTRIRWNLVDLITKAVEHFIQISVICIFSLEFSEQNSLFSLLTNLFIDCLEGFFFPNVCFVLFHQRSGAIGLQAYFWVIYSTPLISVCFSGNIMLFLLLWLCSMVWYQVVWWFLIAFDLVFWLSTVLCVLH